MRLAVFVRLFVKLYQSVSVREHISETTGPNFSRFRVHVECGCMARFFGGGVVIRCVLLDLWMTSCLHIMARSKPRSRIMYILRVTPRGQHVFDIAAYIRTDPPGGSTGLGAEWV